MKRHFKLVVMAACTLAFGLSPLTALAKSAGELAKESEAAAAASANTKPTAKMIIEKINMGCEVLKEGGGEEAFDKFQGTGSQFIFAGTYIWIHDMEGIMRMHPIKYKLNGKQLLTFKDKKGKLFFAEMNRVAKESGSGWVDYMWPKPGEKAPSLKVSFVKACEVGDDIFVLGSGVYGITKEEIENASK